MKRLLDEYKTLRNQKQYLKIIMANVVNRFGDSIDAIAFTWLVYELTHSAVWSTIVFGVNMIPTIIIQPFTGALVERMRKQNIMVLCDIARGVCVAGIAILYLMGILTPWMLLAVTFLNSTFEALRVPAGIAIVPRLLDEEHYDTGIALNVSTSRAMELIGTGCAGFIIAFAGISTAIFIDAATFIGSAFFIAMIHYKEEKHDTALSINSYFRTLKDGFVYMFKKKSVLMICFIGALLNMILIPINSLMPAYIDEILHGGSETLSLLTIALTIGSIIGSFLYPMVSKKFSNRQMFLLTMLLSGIFYLMIIIIPQMLDIRIADYMMVIILFVIMGFMTAMLGTLISVLMMTTIQQDYMARVSAVTNACVCISIPLVSALISILLQFVNFITIMLAAGVISIILFILLAISKSVYVLDEKA